MKNHKISYLIVFLMALLLGISAKAQTTCYVVNDAAERGWSTISNSGNYNLSGLGKTLTFEAKRTAILGFTNSDNFYAEYSNDGNDWKNALTLDLPKKDTWYSFSVDIPTTAKYVRFETKTGATGKKQIRNVKVTRATTLSSSSTSLDFGTVNSATGSATKKITVSYNNTYNPTTLTGSCTNGQFSVTSKSMGETGDAEIELKYSPNSAGDHSGTVTLTMGTASYSFDVSGKYRNSYKFSASAQTSNSNFGYASASVDATEILNTSSSASTTATFTATPANGCTFNGWYDNSNYTGTPVSTSATYQVTLTNNTVNSTVSKTLYAKFKKNQTLSWNNSFDAYTIINGTAVANPATASSGLAVTYTSSNTDAITVDADGTLHGVSLGKSTITASQAGSNDYNPATSISREFSVLDKLQPVFTPSFGGTQAALKVGENVTVGLTDVTDGFSISATTPDIVSWSRTGNTVTVTALKEGSTILTFNDPGNAITNPASASYTISVSKIENTLAVNMASLETTVGGTLAVTFSGRNNNDTPIEVALSNQVFSSSVNSGSSVISYSDGIVTALNAGTATITFSQAATGKYTAAVQKNFDVIVAKNGNSISVTIDGQQRNSINLGRNVSVPFSYTSASDAQFSVVMTSGSESIASISGSSIVTHDTDGTVIWSISQPETYKYEAASTSVRVKVNSTSEAEGYVYTGWTGNGQEWSGMNKDCDLTLQGVPDVLTFGAYRTGAGNLTISYSVDGTNWTTLQTISVTYVNGLSSNPEFSYYSVNVPENARYIRLHGSSSIHHYHNVKVTRKTYVRASSDKTDLGTVNTGSTATATITVDWSSTNGGDIAIESSNPNFTFSLAAITGTANKDGKTAVTVTYSPDPAKLGADEATITVSDLFYSQELKLTATAAKQGTSITKNYDDSAASSLKVDGTISDAFKFSGVSSATPSSSQDADFYYVIDQHVSGNAEGSDHPDMVIAYDSATNKVTALNAGTATITIHQKSTALYSATSASFAFAVAKHDQTIAWDNEISDLTLKKGQSLESNTATASSELPVTYSSSNTLSITVDAATGKLTAVGAGADVEITAAQNGNYKYNPVSISRKFTVFAQSAPVFTPSFEGSATAVKVDDNFTISLENVSDGLDGDFTVTSSTEGVLSWSRSDNVLTFTALDEGEVKVTLAQKGNDDYLAKTAEYTVTVTIPDDYAVLSPVGQLPAAGEYRKITLKRTIPAGLSTVALPFTTTLAALVSGTSNGNAKAYVLRNVGVDSEKGYVFYFKEVESGQLSAGMPYVIFLENEIKNPVWTSQEGIQLSGNAGTVTCGAWSITANFEAGKAMNGLYGVVNSADVNNIMLGGAGSTLNAYSAYIIEEDMPEEETKASMGVQASNEGLVPLFTIAVK